MTPCFDENAGKKASSGDEMAEVKPDQMATVDKETPRSKSSGTQVIKIYDSDDLEQPEVEQLRASPSKPERLNLISIDGPLPLDGPMPRSLECPIPHPMPVP